MDTLRLPRGDLRLPAFFPDGTYGAVKSAAALDLLAVGVPGVEMNSFHLLSKPGLAVIKKHGGIHGFSGFPGVILTDSGGFQAYSMLRENEAYGTVRKDGIIFRPDMGREKLILSPEKCVQAQFALGSDIIMCLDLCTHPDDDYEHQKLSVETTVRWAKQCKAEYVLQLKNRGNPVKRPLLFAIIQGGADKSLREICARELAGIGFDGYGFGGWPLDGEGAFMDDILAFTASLMPEGSVKYAMGVGKPEEIVRCVKMGYRLFDCVIPTREARRQRLYAYENANDIRPADVKFYSFIYIMDDKYAADSRPISEGCDCPLCAHHSRAYLRHLFKLGDGLALRLATLHNLRFYQSLMEAIQNGR